MVGNVYVVVGIVLGFYLFVLVNIKSLIFWISLLYEKFILYYLIVFL